MQTASNTSIFHVYPLNIFRTVLVIIVFMLHTSIFSAPLGFFYTETTWFLKTPAWAGVWLCFLLSGYLIGKGFFSGRYKENEEYTIKSILAFYIKRLKKIGIPTWIFSFFSVLLIQPTFFIENKEVIVKILTFRYFNNPNSNIIGATWYVSTLMWLYLIAPFLCMLIEIFLGNLKQWNNVVIGTVFLVVAILGLFFRLFLYKKGVDWSSMVYVPYYCNLDIYACGILINLFKHKDTGSKENRFLGSIVLGLLVAVLILNIRIYYLEGKYLFLYQYIFPTIYILIGGLFLLFFGKKEYIIPNYFKKLSHNPLCIIDKFANISFEFYLVHSMILNSISVYITGRSPLQSHLLLMAFAFLVSVILSSLMHKAFQERGRGS